MMPLTAILDRLLNYASQTQPGIVAALQPGYERAIVEQYTPFIFPPDVLELYRWHNGTEETEEAYHLTLFYYHRFLSLEEAYQTYLDLMQVNADIGFEGYHPSLFPLFTFDGEYYSVLIDPQHADYGSIYFVFHGEAKVYDSLSSMLRAILECYQIQAYRLQGDDIIVDEGRVAAIKALYNPCRRVADGTIWGYHP